jgi:hypothetical protein
MIGGARRTQTRRVGVTETTNCKNKGGTSTSQLRIPTDAGTLQEHISYCKKQLNGVDVDRALSLRVLSAAFTMQLEYLTKIPSGPVERPAIRDRICSMFKISAPTFGSIKNEFLGNNKTIYVSSRGGNTTRKVTRIRCTKRTMIKVREFIREKRKKN